MTESTSGNSEPWDPQECSIFFSSWWLDAVAGKENWGRAEVIENGKLVAMMPWTRKIRFKRFVCLQQPPLTQTLGPWFARPAEGTKYAKTLARQKDLTEELILQLPKCDYFQQNFSPEITNWLPFYWKGFKQTTRYTYRIENLFDTESLWANLLDKIRTDIRKASKRDIVVEKSNENIEEFLELNEMTFARQGKTLPYSREFVKNLHRKCQEKNASAIFFARDRNMRPHAAVYLVWNKYCAYYLMGGGDPALRNSGATSLALWEAIKFSATVSKRFDFEGSMLEPVERFVRGFGAKQTPYFEVNKVPSKLLRIAFAAKSVVN